MDFNPLIGRWALRWMVDQVVAAGVHMDTSGLLTFEQYRQFRERRPDLFRPSANGGVTNLFQD